MKINNNSSGGFYMDVPGGLHELGKAFANLSAASAAAAVTTAKQSLSASTSIDHMDNLDVSKLLSEALKNKDITVEQLSELKQQYQNDSYKLSKLLDEFAKMRMNYLMGFTFDELDKNGLLQELNDKYFGGFKLKYFEVFGKFWKEKGDGKTYAKGDVTSLMAYTLHYGYIDQDLADGWERNFGANPEKLKELFLDRILQATYFDVGDFCWDQCSPTTLDAMKTDSLQQYKKIYKQKFGIDFKEPK